MQFHFAKGIRTAGPWVLVIGLAGPASAIDWDGGAGVDDNWSTGLNWVGDNAPATTTTDTINFPRLAEGSPAKNVFSVVDVDYTIGSLVFRANTVVYGETTYLDIAAGKTLTLNGGQLTTGSFNPYVVMGGAGTLQLGTSAKGTTLLIGPDTVADGRLTVTSSIHTVNLDTVRVAYNGRADNTAGGIVDLTGATFIGDSFTIDGSLDIGLGFESRGAMYLPQVDAGANQIRIGSLTAMAGAVPAIANSRGLLELRGTVFDVTTGVALVADDTNDPDNVAGAPGTNTTDFAILRTKVLGNSAGLNLLNSGSSALSITGHGLLEISFDQPVSPEYTGSIYYGLRWAGDHVAALQALVTSGNLNIIDNAGANPAIFAQDGFTYIGAPVPEPASMSLFMAGAALLLGRRRRRRAGS